MALIIVGLILLIRIEMSRSLHIDSFGIDDFEHPHPDHPPDWKLLPN